MDKYSFEMIVKPNYRGVRIDKGELSPFAIWILSKRRGKGVCWENYENLWQKTAIKDLRESGKEISFARTPLEKELIKNQEPLFYTVFYTGKRIKGLELYQGNWKRQDLEKGLTEEMFYLAANGEGLPNAKSLEKLEGFASIIPHLLLTFDSRLEAYLDKVVAEYHKVKRT
jgi:hypothetical protein